MPDSTVIVITGSGEKVFDASEWAEDDRGDLTVLNGSRRVARFVHGAWQGVHLRPYEPGQGHGVITETGA